jgi:hypothetical protein
MSRLAILIIQAVKKQATLLVNTTTTQIKTSSNSNNTHPTTQKPKEEILNIDAPRLNLMPLLLSQMVILPIKMKIILRF